MTDLRLVERKLASSLNAVSREREKRGGDRTRFLSVEAGLSVLECFAAVCEAASRPNG